MKKDTSIKNIVTAAIRRKAMGIETWIWTRLWDDGDSAITEIFSGSCSFAAGELPILYSYIDLDTWTVFTSRAVWYANTGKINSVQVNEIVGRDLGFFKGGLGREIEWMLLRQADGTEHRCPYHTGKTSMGPVYAIDTLLQITQAA